MPVVLFAKELRRSSSRLGDVEAHRLTRAKYVRCFYTCEGL